METADGSAYRRGPSFQGGHHGAVRLRAEAISSGRRRFETKARTIKQKGYWIGRVDVTDPESYQKYVAANAAPFAKYGARFVIRGGRFEAVEGAARSRNVVLEFPSYQAALECYRSPEYADAMALRLDASEADILIIEGYDGVQPGEG